MLYNQSFTKDASLVFTSSDVSSGSTSIIQSDTNRTNHDTLDLGGDGFWEGYLVMDISAIEVATGDEVYTITVQLSDSDDFTNIYEKVAIHLGDEGTGVNTGTADSTAGRYSIPINNEYKGVGYRYMRLSTLAAGSLASGLTMTAFLAPRRP